MNNRLTLDHLVYAVSDLDESIATFESSLGVAPRFGGRHTGIGTHNAVLSLGDDSYVELIARDPQTQTPGTGLPFGLDTLTAPRLVTWAVRSHAIDHDVERSRAGGFDPGVVLDMTRDEPDGSVVRWKLSLQTKPFGEGLVPFVIDWGSSRHPAQTASGEPTGCSLESLLAHHPDPQSILAAFEALGCELPVESAESPGMLASLRGPAGSLELD